jgi:dipeptide/tripeptide permease
MPPLAPVFRANLPRLLGPGDLLTAGLAIDSTLQELIFITGPLLVVVSTVPAGAGGALVLMALFVLAGTIVFVSGRALDDAPRRGAGDRGGSALHSAGLRALLPIAALVVAAFSATEVAVVAAADGAGHRSIAGLLLALWASGSAVGGLVYGSRSWPGSPEQRLVVLLLALAVTLTVPAAGPPLLVLALLLLAGGPFIAPAIACAYVLVQRVASTRELTEAYTWLATAFGTGAALGAALAGAAVDAWGWQGGFGLAGGAMAGGAALTLALRGVLTGAAEV